MNPAFATEISVSTPCLIRSLIPYVLPQARLRFLLADDAGGWQNDHVWTLYSRNAVQKAPAPVLITLPPPSLVGNWHRELLSLFNLSFRVAGSDARNGNPFLGEAGERIIISLDTLCGSRMFARLGESSVAPYDLVIFDEAHKLAADRGSDLRVRKTVRYQLAEALAGVHPRGKDFQLGWSAHHLILLTATPHMGKDFPYFALWRLLEPEILATPDAFDEFPFEQRRSHFIRRTKEEMVYLDGRPLYPKRLSDTLGYELSQGDVSEQRLYDETTNYLRFVYNKAKMLNREAARLAMSVFQRRLASSTFALLRSFERRIEKLDKLIDDIQSGRLTTDQLITYQQRLFEEGDVFDTKTADDEASEEGYEENEISEDKLLQGVVAASWPIWWLRRSKSISYSIWLEECMKEDMNPNL